MKRILVALFLILSVGIMVISCQKKENESSNPSLLGTWKVVSSTDPVHYPATNVTWTFGTNTVTISYDGEYHSNSYIVDGSVLILGNGSETKYITIVNISSSTLVLSVDGATIKFQKV